MNATAVRPSVERTTLLPVVRELSADTLTPIGAYRALAQPGRSCLLESVAGNERLTRFSFIGLDYLETLTLRGDDVSLDEVRGLLGSFAFERGSLGFSAGAVCAFGYDAARALERIGLRPPGGLGSPDVYVAVPGTWIAFDHFTHRATLLGLARTAAEIPAVERRIDAYVERMYAAAAAPAELVGAVGPVAATLDRDEFLERIARAKCHIREGDVYQVQLGIRFDVPFTGSPFDVYRGLRARNPSPYMFYLEAGPLALFGASPEFLIRVEDRSVRLRPLAGTRGRGATPAADDAIAAGLLADPKECAEHIMLVDLGRNDLGAVCTPGSVTVNELMAIERYSHVMHIVSDITGELRDDCDALDAFAAAFPAGTVTGAPKIRAMQLIDALEPVARGPYAGSVVRIDFDGNLDSCIVLRSVAAIDGRAYWQASAGIVADSDPAAEYAEVFAKTRIIAETFGVAP